MLKTFLLVIASFIFIILFVKIALPRIIKSRRKKFNYNDRAFLDRENDIEKLTAYFLPDDYLKYQDFISDKKVDPLDKQKKLIELEKIFSEIYPDYLKEVDKRFIKSFFTIYDQR
jgi:hypothetical protein